MTMDFKISVYKICNGKNDLNVAEKILDGIERGLVNKDNYWNYVDGFIKNLKSDKWIAKWEKISKFIYENYYSK